MVQPILLLKQNAPIIYQMVRSKKIAKLNEQLLSLRIKYKDEEDAVEKQLITERANDIKRQIAELN